MAERKRSSKKGSEKRIGKRKNKSWSDEELTAFARVLSSSDDRDKPWAFLLETMALKKSSNEKVFEKIKQELNVEIEVEQLRRKYKWFKTEWRKMNTKIRSGSGLAAKDTEVPKWYEFLDPIFTQGVDNMIELSSKAVDVCESSSEEELTDGDGTQSEIETLSISSKERLTKRRSSSSNSINTDTTDGKESDGGDLESGDENSPDGKKLAEGDDKRPKTDIKPCKSSTKKRMPKTQTAAMWQIVKSLEESTSKQEKKSDERLNAILETERRRDELFLSFQREQAEASRQHELAMARLLLQAGIQPSPSFPSPPGFSGASGFPGSYHQMSQQAPFFNTYPPGYSQGESNNFDQIG